MHTMKDTKHTMIEPQKYPELWFGFTQNNPIICAAIMWQITIATNSVTTGPVKYRGFKKYMALLQEWAPHM
jgi:hypothetical protein